MSDDVETLTLEERKNAVQTQLIKVFGEKSSDMQNDYVDTIWSQVIALKIAISILISIIKPNT